MNYKLFMLPGYFVGIGCLGLITYRTMLALGTETGTIMVTVNQYGEQYLDIAFLGFLWVVCLMGFLAIRSPTKESRITHTHQNLAHPRGENRHDAPLDFPTYIANDKPARMSSAVIYEQPDLTKTLAELEDGHHQCPPSNGEK